jgi:hypothetical protein
MRTLVHKHVKILALRTPEVAQMRADRVVYGFKFLSCLLAVDNTEFFQRRTKCWKSQGKLEEALSDISQLLALESLPELSSSL